MRVHEEREHGEVRQPVGFTIPISPRFSVGIISFPTLATHTVHLPRLSRLPYFSKDLSVISFDLNSGLFPLSSTYAFPLYSGIFVDLELFVALLLFDLFFEEFALLLVFCALVVILALSSLSTTCVLLFKLSSCVCVSVANITLVFPESDELILVLSHPESIPTANINAIKSALILFFITCSMYLFINLSNYLFVGISLKL